MDAQLNALPTLPVRAWGISGCLNSAFSRHFSTFYGSSVQSMDTQIGARHRRRTPMIHRWPLDLVVAAIPGPSRPGRHLHGLLPGLGGSIGFEKPPCLEIAPPVKVTGFTDLSAGKDFSDKLTELVVKVSGGYSLSSTGGAGWSNYSIAMHNSLDVKAFADQITWARVTRVSGQTIEIDASAP
jgi:hypothetical protein